MSQQRPRKTTTAWVKRRVAALLGSTARGSSGDADRVARSGLFDPAYYLRENPDVAASGADPLAHYLADGHRENREPSAAFDGRTYLARNPDVAAAGWNPLVHWLVAGASEGRTSPLRSARTHAVSDYELLERSGFFDAAYYLRTNEDVAQAGLDPLAHYLSVGSREGRMPSAFFDGAAYLRRYPELDAAGVDPLVHWLRFGRAEGRPPTPRSSGIDGMSDYDLVSRSGLFDPAYYLRENPDVAASGDDPLAHYLSVGFREGRKHSAFFDGRVYDAHHPELAAAGINPLVHWLRTGAIEGVPPPVGRTDPWTGSDYDLIARSGLFDPDYYRRENPDVAAANDDPLSHYLAMGFREGRRHSPIFDGSAYLADNADVAASGENPLAHWLKVGVVSGRRPPLRSSDPDEMSDYDLAAASGLFDVGHYLRSNPDVAAAGTDALAHYLAGGHREGREPSSFFDGQGYVTRNPDLSSGHTSPLVHWLRIGSRDGRLAPWSDGSGRGEIALSTLCDPTRDEAGAGALAGTAAFSVLTPSYDTEPRFLFELFQSLRNQTYGGWEWIVVDNGSENPATLAALRTIRDADPRVSVVFLDENAGIARGTNIALRHATGTHVALVDHDDLLARDVFERIAQALDERPDADLVYTDECKLSEDGRVYDLFLKPDWSPVLLENTMYVAHLSVYRRPFIEELGGLRAAFDGTQDYDLVLRASRRVRDVVHVPTIGYLWRVSATSTAGSSTAKPYAIARQQAALESFVHDVDRRASVPPGFADGYWRTTYSLPEHPPLLSYVIPTGAGRREVRGRSVDLLRNCIESFEARRFYPNVEYVVVHNGDLSADQLAFLDGVGRVTLVHYQDASLNLARKMNMGVAAARGDFVCLLNDDVEADTVGGGEELVSFMLAHPQVGIMGPLCLFEDGRVQHNGVLLLDQGPAHAGVLSSPHQTGAVGNPLQCRREVFGVTGALAIVRRIDYERLGGFDETLPLNYNDVDFCLRVRGADLTCVVDPGIRVFHFESATKTGTFKCEKERLFSRWPALDDPYFNEGFDQRNPVYRVSARKDHGPVEHDPVAFEGWLDRRLADRIRSYPATGAIKLSICVPVFNQPRAFLEEMLQSCLMQTYGNREVLIIDDGSSLAETTDWLERVERSGLARIVRHTTNQGIAGANRTWLREATGDYVLPLDADDFLTIDALQIVAHWIERNPEASVFYSDEFKSDPASGKRHPYFKPAFDPFLSTNCCYQTHLMAWRRETLLDVAAYSNDAATWCHDWDTIARVWAQGIEPVHIPELLYAWRISPGSTASLATGTKPAAIASQRAVLDRLIGSRGRETRVAIGAKTVASDTGMWSLRALSPVADVVMAEAAAFWGSGGVALGEALRSGREWLALFAESVEDEGALLGLSALAHWDDRLDAVSGILTDETGATVRWSGAFFGPEGSLIEPYRGGALAGSYHGQLNTQHCVDVAAPANVLIRISALRRVVEQLGETVSADACMVRLGVNAAEAGRLVAVTPYVKAAWRPAPGLRLPVDRDGLLREVAPALLRSRWYHYRLTPDRPFGIDPPRWTGPVLPAAGDEGDATRVVAPTVSVEGRAASAFPDRDRPVDARSMPGASQVKNTAILVLGMHRSGTSTIAGALGILGAAMPKVGLGLSSDNPKGHFEPAEIVALQDRVFATVGQHWWDWDRVPDAWFGSPDHARFAAELAGQVRAEFGDAPLSVIKDPRTCKLVPLWRDVVRTLDLDPVAVLPYRDPVEVARSLNRRDGFPVANGHLMWLRYVLDAEFHSRGMRRVFLRYADLVSDWRGTLAGVLDGLRLDLPLRSASVVRDLQVFIDPGLRHGTETASATEAKTALHPWITTTSSLYDRLLLDPNDREAQDGLDAIRIEFDRACDVFAAALAATNRGFEDAHALNARIPGLEAQLQAAAAANARIPDLEARIATLRDRPLSLELGPDSRELLDGAAGRVEALLVALAADRRPPPSVALDPASLERLGAVLEGMESRLGALTEAVREGVRAAESDATRAGSPRGWWSRRAN